MRILEQWRYGHAGSQEIGDTGDLVHVYTQRGAISQIELPEFHKNNATCVRSWRMTRNRRVANVGAGRKVTMLILKDPVQNDELLAATVGVRRELAVRCVSNHRGRPRHLITQAVQHATLHARHR